MRIPATPPDWLRLVQQANEQGKSAQLFQIASKESSRKDRYLHWEDYRHRASPVDGISVEEQWAAIRMSRAIKSAPTKLKDAKDRPFTFFLTEKAFEALHEIDLRCGGGISTTSDGIIQERTRDRYYVDSLIQEALTSSQLEGAVVTRSEAREMIRTNRDPHTKHERMVMNNYRTMRLVSSLKEEALSVDLILRIHKEVTAGTLEKPSDEGRFRAAGDDVRVEDEESGEVLHVPPAAERLEARMAGLCDFANEPGMHGFLHPVIRSIILHFWIAYDHPFVDGNGRTARALFYWSMLRHGYWMAEFFSISQEILRAPKKYYRAFLFTETDGNDLNYFLLHQLDVVQGSLQSLYDYIRRKQDDAESFRRLLGSCDYNSRQLALLKHALENPLAVYTVASHQNSHGVSNQTAKNDLVALESQGLLVRGKQGKAFAYRPAPDLREKLELRAKLGL